MSEAPTSWYITEDGTVVIPAGCTPCCGLPDDGHYFGCPSHGFDEAAREQEEDAWYGSNREDWDANAASAKAEAAMYAADESYYGGGEAAVS